MLSQMRWIKDNSALRWQAETSTKPCKIHVKNSEDKKTDLEGNSRRMQSSRTTGRDGWIVSIYMLTGGEETRFLDASRPWWRWVRRGPIWQVNGHTRFCQEFFFIPDSNFLFIGTLSTERRQKFHGEARCRTWCCILVCTRACRVPMRNGEWIALKFQNCRDIYGPNVHVTSILLRLVPNEMQKLTTTKLIELISL